MGSGLRHGLPDPGLTGRDDLDADLLHHHRHGLQGDADRQRHRPLRAHVRHARATPYGYSLWEFQVYGTGGSPITPPAAAAEPDLPGDRLVWSDEFNGAAGTKPDAAKWTLETGTGQNNELQYYTNNDNASMDGAGNLVIEARRRSPRARPARAARASTPRPDQHRRQVQLHLRPGRGPDQGAEEQRPLAGVLDAGRRLPRPAAPGPYIGEIDIMEHVGRTPNRCYSTLHAPAYNGGGGYGSRTRSPATSPPPSTYGPWTGTARA